MNELVETLIGLDLQNIQTYIQSGNVVFKSKKINVITLADRMSKAIKISHGFKPEVLLLQLDDFKNALLSNPYKETEIEPKTLHLYFLKSQPKNPDLKKLESLKQDNERFTLLNTVFYLHAPDGIGRSKLASHIEKTLGVAVTARNLSSVCKILALAT